LPAEQQKKTTNKKRLSVFFWDPRTKPTKMIQVVKKVIAGYTVTCVAAKEMTPSETESNKVVELKVENGWQGEDSMVPADSAIRSLADSATAAPKKTQKQECEDAKKQYEDNHQSLCTRYCRIIQAAKKQSDYDCPDKGGCLCKEKDDCEDKCKDEEKWSFTVAGKKMEVDFTKTKKGFEESVEKCDKEDVDIDMGYSTYCASASTMSAWTAVAAVMVLNALRN